MNMAKKSVMEKEVGTIENFSLLTDFDIHLFKSGKHYRLYEKLGAHVVSHKGTEGTYFAVWAPNARDISVIGHFNGWQGGQHKLFPRWDESGIWEGFFPDIKHGEAYKYYIHSNTSEILEKADPFASFAETPPRTASIVWEPKYEWKDQEWLERRKSLEGKPQPYSVYEVHIGSWKKKHEEGGRSLSYPEMANELVQ